MNVKRPHKNPLIIRLLLSLLALVFMLIGFQCPHQNGVEPRAEEPVVEAVTLNYSQEQQTLFIAARVSDPQGYNTIDSVGYQLYFKAADSLADDQCIQSGPLYNNGTRGDIIEQDDVYSYLITDSVDQGHYRCMVQAFDQEGHPSLPVSQNEAAIANSPPQIYKVAAPSRFEKGDTLFFEIRGTDPQGISDILGITYFVELPNGDFRTHASFQLRDDGQFGDRQADDGIYSVKQPSNAESELQGLFRFYFYARDMAGAFSDTLKVAITNPGVTLIAPDYADTLEAGEQYTIAWQSAYIEELTLEYTLNAQEPTPTYENIIRVDAADSSYNWAVPSGISSENCKVKIYDTDRPSRYDISDRAFVIEP